MSYTTDTATPAEIWVNPDSARQARRLTPVAIDGILCAHHAGSTNGEISRAFGISKPTVARVLKRAEDMPDFKQTVADLSELADAERELRESALALGYSEQTIDSVIEVIRLGHLAHRVTERQETTE